MSKHDLIYEGLEREVLILNIAYADKRFCKIGRKHVIYFWMSFKMCASKGFKKHFVNFHMLR